MRHGTRRSRRRPGLIVTTAAAIIAAAAIAAAVGLHNRSDPNAPLPVPLPTRPQSYLGLFASPAPDSYAGVTSFTNETKVSPDVVMYYSGWYQPFQTGFATTAASHGAVPFVQMDPTGVSLAAIAAGRYDDYLSKYAVTVRAYRHPVILSFGHEMNGNWYSWGYQNSSPRTFVAAWRHIVRVFRALGARNVTWMWTVNIINDTRAGRIPSPHAWWPGKSYVNWVGIDGYYLKSSWQFAPLFGPTILAVRGFTDDPILIGETGALPAAGQSAKIADLFAGIRDYGLLGFVWFDATDSQLQSSSPPLDFRISAPAAITAFRRGAETTYKRPES
jgi:mannan endo-1,4-beta-mannosidase